MPVRYHRPHAQGREDDGARAGAPQAEHGAARRRLASRSGRPADAGGGHPKAGSDGPQGRAGRGRREAGGQGQGPQGIGAAWESRWRPYRIARSAIHVREGARPPRRKSQPQQSAGHRRSPFRRRPDHCPGVGNNRAEPAAPSS